MAEKAQPPPPTLLPAEGVCPQREASRGREGHWGFAGGSVSGEEGGCSRGVRWRLRQGVGPQSVSETGFVNSHS